MVKICCFLIKTGSNFGHFATFGRKDLQALIWHLWPQWVLLVRIPRKQPIPLGFSEIRSFWTTLDMVWKSHFLVQKSLCGQTGGPKSPILGQNFPFSLDGVSLSIFSMPLKRFKRELDLSILTHQSWGREVVRSTCTAVHFLHDRARGALFGPRFLPGPEKHPF